MSTDPTAWLHDLRVVAITDRRRMVAADLLAGGDWAAIARAFGQAIERALAGCPPGRVVVQVREKDLDGGPLLQLVRAAQPFAPVMVNDRLDVALAAGALGVHLPERGLAIAEVRRLAPGLVIGASRHATPDTAVDRGAADRDAADRGADLLQLGSIWPTPAKPGAPTLGPDALAAPHAAAVLVAVGGIDSVARAERAAAAGADAIAVIRAAWAHDPTIDAPLARFVDAVDRGRARRA